MLGHESNGLLVADLALAQSQLSVHGFARSEQVARRFSGLANKLAQRILSERLDVKVDALELDSAGVEQLGQPAAGGAGAFLVDGDLGHR